MLRNLRVRILGGSESSGEKEAAIARRGRRRSGELLQPISMLQRPLPLPNPYTLTSSSAWGNFYKNFFVEITVRSTTNCKYQYQELLLGGSSRVERRGLYTESQDGL